MNLFTRVGRAWDAFRAAPRPRGTTSRRAIFTGAAGGRLNADWSPSILPGDEEVRLSARELRKRGRDLIKNNAYIARHVELRRNNLIGPFGPRLQAMLRDAKGNLDENRNDAIEEAWQRYVRGPVTIDGQLNLVEYMKLMVETRISDGESFTRKWRGFKANPFGIGLEQIDVDQVDETYNQFLAPGRPEIRSGVELGSFGQPLAYHVWEGPYASAQVYRRRIRLDARDVIHVFRRKRAGQTRGYTPLAPVMQTVRHFDGYEDAAVMHARAGACQMAAIVKKKGGDPFGDGEGASPPPLDDTGAVPASTPRAESRTMEAMPAVLQELEEGEELQSFNPSQPHANHEPFSKAMGRKMASGLNESYVALMSDPGEANFSAARIDQLFAREVYESEQEEFFFLFLDNLYADWLQSALLTGQLNLGSIDASMSLAHEWRGRRWQHVQPEEERKAQLLGIGGGLASRTEYITAGGREPKEVWKELAQEEAEAERLGIDISAKPEPAESKSDEPTKTTASKNDKGERGTNRLGALVNGH